MQVNGIHQRQTGLNDGCLAALASQCHTTISDETYETSQISETSPAHHAGSLSYIAAKGVLYKPVSWW